MTETDKPLTREDMFRGVDLRMQQAVALLHECRLLLECLRRGLPADEEGLHKRGPASHVR